MKSVGSHDNLSLHSLWWRRWSSDTLWATLIRLWLHSLSCYLQICGGFLCNFIDMFSQLSCAVRTTENSWTFGSTDSASRTPQCLCDSNSRRNPQTLVCWQFKAYTSGWEWRWGYVQNQGSRMSVRLLKLEETYLVLSLSLFYTLHFWIWCHEAYNHH
jgi:hypothetical protein